MTELNTALRALNPELQAAVRRMLVERLNPTWLQEPFNLNHDQQAQMRHIAQLAREAGILDNEHAC